MDCVALGKIREQLLWTAVALGKIGEPLLWTTVALGKIGDRIFEKGCNYGGWISVRCRIVVDRIYEHVPSD